MSPVNGLRTFILSLASHRYLLATPPMRPHYASLDGALTYHLHDIKITFTPATLSESPVSHHAEVCVL